MTLFTYYSFKLCSIKIEAQLFCFLLKTSLTNSRAMCECSLEVPRVLNEFKPEYGMERYLVVLVSDRWQAHGGGGASILALLDLSAAFGTIDHGILLVVVRATILQWFFYLVGEMGAVDS